MRGGEKERSKLLLDLVGLLLSLLAGTLLEDTTVTLVSAGHTKGTVGRGLTLGLGDGTGSDMGDGGSDGEKGTGGELGGGLEVLGGGITLLDAVRTAGEDNEASTVGLEAVDVGVEGFLRLVATTVVDGNTNGPGFLLGDTSGLELLKGKTTASTDLDVVLDGRAPDSGAKETVNGTRGSGSSLLDAVQATTLLPARLVEPGADPALPVLAEVDVGELVVVLDGLFDGKGFE